KPSRCSRAPIWKLIVDWLIESASCAPLKPPCSTTERNTVNARISEADRRNAEIPLPARADHISRASIYGLYFPYLFVCQSSHTGAERAAPGRGVGPDRAPGKQGENRGKQ